MALKKDKPTLKKQSESSERSAKQWVGRALTDNGEPSSTRLNSFIAVCVFSTIIIMFSIRLVFSEGEHTTIGNVFEGVCYALAGLGGVSYVGGAIARKTQNKYEEDEPPYVRGRRYDEDS